MAVATFLVKAIIIIVFLSIALLSLCLLSHSSRWLVQSVKLWQTVKNK